MPELAGTAPGRTPPASARCGSHPAAAAVDLCQRCGAFLCGDCVELVEEDVLCSACFQRQGGNAPPTLRARLPLALGLAGLVLGFVPGLIGLALARRELRRIDAGLAPRTGRRYARAGLILGWINFALFFLGLFLLAALVVFLVWRGAA